jgi:ribose 5-phosphate isomerase B
LFTARLARRNNDANVLCMGSDFMGVDLALAILEEWINTPYGKKEDDTLQRLADIESGAAPRKSAPGV